MDLAGGCAEPGQALSVPPVESTYEFAKDAKQPPLTVITVSHRVTDPTTLACPHRLSVSPGAMPGAASPCPALATGSHKTESTHTSRPLSPIRPPPRAPPPRLCPQRFLPRQVQSSWSKGVARWAQAGLRQRRGRRDSRWRGVGHFHGDIRPHRWRVHALRSQRPHGPRESPSSPSTPHMHRHITHSEKNECRWKQLHSANMFIGNFCEISAYN